MSVGIVTFTYGNNYGQRLQNLAMQEFLKQYDRDVYTLKQVPPVLPLKFRLKQSVKNLLSGNMIAQRKRTASFDRFNSRYIRFYKEALQANSREPFPEKEFDFFVCGSDQIWSPYSQDVNDTMFLTFAPRNKRIALSPSIAAKQIPEQKLEQFRAYFEGFPYISTREYESSELVRKVSGKNAETLIDPTLMFDADFWSGYAQKPSVDLPERYALLYFLGNNDRLRNIQEVCRRRNMVPVDMLHDSRFLTMGPSEFLYLIKNAGAVFTDSYHGTIFSILFETPLTLLNRSGSSLDMSSRFETLFQKLGISKESVQFTEADRITPISVKKIEPQLEAERKKFVEFFEKSRDLTNH